MKGSQPVWGHADLVKLAHHLYDSHKELLWAFKFMMAAHDRGDLIRHHDQTHKWRDKGPTYLEAWAWKDPDFMPNRQFDDVVSFLFPEIAERLRGDPQ